MNGPSFDRVIDALRRVTTEAATQSGQWTKFHCPVPTHGQGRGDRNPSLGVKYDPDRAKTVTCFSRCRQEDVLETADLCVRDLFDHLPDRARTGAPPRRPRPQQPAQQPRASRPRERSAASALGAQVGPRRLVATYTYTTAGNEPVGRVLRYAVPHERGVDKTFSQRRWDPEQRDWIGGGFPPVLYRAPIVAWAISEGTPILVCEGEKDVDRAISAGYPATCNVGGAGSFRAEHAQQMQGAARVVIVADRDLPGFEHAALVHDRLQGLVGRIDVMHAATGKDLSDHFDAGHDINELLRIQNDQLKFVRPDPSAGRTTGPRSTEPVAAPGRQGWRPGMDWGLDR